MLSYMFNLNIVRLLRRLWHFIFSRNELKKQEILSKALDCKGWSNVSKLSLLYDLVKKTEMLDGDILEVGSAWGRSTVLLGLTSSKMIWSVDPHTGGRAFIEKGLVQDSYEEFLLNLSRNYIQNKVRVVRHTTDEVLKQNIIPTETCFSLVFIDGLHTPAGVLADVDLCYERTVSGGIVIFDDYFEKSCADYAQTIDNIVNDLNVKLHTDSESSLVYFIRT